MSEEISPYWEHLAIGEWLRILDQDRAQGTILVREEYPDGRHWHVTLQIIDVQRTKGPYEAA